MSSCAHDLSSSAQTHVVLIAGKLSLSRQQNMKRIKSTSLSVLFPFVALRCVSFIVRIASLFLTHACLCAMHILTCIYRGWYDALRFVPRQYYPSRRRPQLPFSPRQCGNGLLESAPAPRPQSECAGSVGTSVGGDAGQSTQPVHTHTHSHDGKCCGGGSDQNVSDVQRAAANLQQGAQDQLKLYSHRTIV